MTDPTADPDYRPGVEDDPTADPVIGPDVEGDDGLATSYQPGARAEYVKVCMWMWHAWLAAGPNCQPQRRLLTA